MSSVKITQLPNVLGNQINPAVDVLPIVRVGADSTDKITVEELGTLFGGGLEGTQYVYVAANGTDVENAVELQAAYNTAITMSPSSTNRITIIAGPGNYNFFPATFIMDTEFIDLVSLDGNRSIVFNAPINPIFGPSEIGSISITANDVFVKGVDVQLKKFKIENNLYLLKVENCIGGESSFSSGSVTTVSGTFTNCIGGDYSFGQFVSGTFNNCISGKFSFGAFGGVATGFFNNCIAAEDSFGSFAPGTFVSCQAGTNSFGPNDASGTFTNCIGGESCFGASNLASGIYNYCIAGLNSFGTNMGPSISGQLYFCRLTSGTFQTVTGAGKTVYCVDGNGDPNNQGFAPQNNL